MRNKCLITAVLAAAILDCGCQSIAPVADNNANGNSAINGNVVSVVENQNSAVAVVTNSNSTTAPVQTVVNNNSATNQPTNNLNSATATTIEAREPEAYQAFVNVSAETVTDDGRTARLPGVTAAVARSGANQRIEINAPGGEKIVFLDRADNKHLLILPDSKQYAVLDKESLGADVRKMLTPGQATAQLQKMKNVERVGEETFNGRAAVKYQIKNTTDTKTQVGNLNSAAVVLVDKETGLPLRIEFAGAAQNNQNAQNSLKNFKIVSETSDIRLTAPSALFDEPKDFKKIPADQLRGQIGAALGVLGNMFGRSGNGGNRPKQANANTKIDDQ